MRERSPGDVGLTRLNPLRFDRFGSRRASPDHAGQAEKAGHHQPEGRHWLFPADTLQVKTIPALIENADGIDAAFQTLASGTDTGLLVVPDATTTANRARIVALAARLRVPRMQHIEFFGASGIATLNEARVRPITGAGLHAQTGGAGRGASP
jgi:hypothetical protein